MDLLVMDMMAPDAALQRRAVALRKALAADYTEIFTGEDLRDRRAMYEAEVLLGRIEAELRRRSDEVDAKLASDYRELYEVALEEGYPEDDL